MTGLILGAIGGIGLSAIVFVPALLRKKKADTEKLEYYYKESLRAEKALEELRHEKARLEDENDCLERKNLTASQTLDLIEHKISNREHEVHRIEKSIETLTSVETSIKENMEKAIEERSEALSKEYREAEERCRQEYINTTKEMADEFSKAFVGKRAELGLIEDEIADKQMVYQAILEDEHRRNQEMAKRDFYRLNIPEEDLNEVEKIREITPYFRNPEVLGKAVWTAYFQKPYQDLIARQFKANKPAGIYKITCLPNTKVYVGQSVNVPNRFSEHIKRGLGAETATRNRLYSEMKKWGVENFTFELLEEVSREKLDERERFWIQYFNSADAEAGMNGNKGVKG